MYSDYERRTDAGHIPADLASFPNCCARHRKQAADNAAKLIEVANSIRLEVTCYACPEQYDAYIDAEYVGYLRLRHGHFTVDDAKGETIYAAHPKGDGIFEYSERDGYLAAAKAAIARSVLDRA